MVQMIGQWRHWTKTMHVPEQAIIGFIVNISVSGVF